MRKLIYDVETNGLLNTMDRVHVLCIKDVSDADADKHTLYTYRRHPAGEYEFVVGEDENGQEIVETRWLEAEDTIQEGLNFLMTADVIIGHNIIGFDEKAVRIVYPDYTHSALIQDTLVLARVMMPDTSAVDGRLTKLSDEKKRMPGKFFKKHSLDAWGYRLGRNKGDYSHDCAKKGIDPWAKWNPRMESYCENDVEVNAILWAAIEKDLPEIQANPLEHQTHDITVFMREQGVPFDAAAALTLVENLQSKYDALAEGAKAEYGQWLAPAKKHQVRWLWDDPDGVNRKKKYKLPRKEWGEDMTRAVWGDFIIPKRTRRHIENVKSITADNERRVKKGLAPRPIPPSSTPPLYNEDGSIRPRKLVECDITEGGAYCLAEMKDFNPTSRYHIIDRLTTIHGWVPEDFTEAGNPELNDAVLTKVSDTVPGTKTFCDIFFYNKLIGQVSRGKGSWLNSYNADTGCIHAHINTGGTVSGRCSHDSPNLGQVPALVMEDAFIKETGAPNPKALDKDGNFLPQFVKEDGSIRKKGIMFERLGDYGAECRRLFYTPADINGIAWKQLGVDLSGIEFRCLAERCFEFDKGELINVVLSGDIHQINMDSTGITSRDTIKRVLYGLLYGAGDWKLGFTVDPYASVTAQIALGKSIRAKLMKGLPALAKAIEKIQAQAQRGFLEGLDGRKLPVRNTYSALNLRLQSDAALVSKKWLCLSEDYLLAEGFDMGWLGDFTFMLYVHDEIQTAIKEALVEIGAKIIKKAAADAGMFFGFNCPIAAESKIGQDWCDCH